MILSELKKRLEELSTVCHDESQIYIMNESGAWCEMVDIECENPYSITIGMKEKED